MVERKARQIRFYDIERIKVTLPDIQFKVTCSKGTYIRTICHDLGERLGTGAHMTSLIRTEVSPFHIDNAITINQLEKLVEADKVVEALMPVDLLFKTYDQIVVPSEYDKLIYNGNKIPFQCEVGIKYRVYNNANQFLGIYIGVIKEHVHVLKPEKLFI